MLIELHFLPSLEYMAWLLKSENISLETAETFQRQTYRNRCYIRAANQIDRLSIPVRAETKHHRISEVQIDYSDRWHISHWRSVCTAYRKAPYFEYFSPYFEPIWLSETPLLFDLNWQFFQTVFKLLGISKTIHFTETFEKNTFQQDDYRNFFECRKNKIENHEPYTQLFGDRFEPNLSILDLLFCEGRNARNYLERLGKRF